MLYIFSFLEKFPQYLVLTISKYGLESSGLSDSTGFHMEYQGDRQDLHSESAQNLVRLGSGLLIRTGQNLIKKIGSNTAISGQKNSEWILIRSGGSVERPPMMLPLPPQSPSPAPEQHEPEEYIPRLKGIYHPFINGLSHVSLSLVYVKYMLISFCKVIHAMQMGTISLKEPHHHLKLKKHVMTGLPLRAKTNLKSQISSTAERRCHKAILTNFSNYGIFHL